MQCPDCGYVMTAFDKDCPRCEKMASRMKPCLKCGTASAVNAMLCQKCGHRFGDPTEKPALKPPAAPASPLSVAAPSVSTTPPTQSIHPQASASMTQPPLTAEMLACRVCGGTSAQKVSAVVRAGSWITESRGHFVGAGSDGQGHTMLVGGPTRSTSHGQTGTASLLAPPARPSFAPSYVGTILVPIFGYALALLFWTTVGPVAVTITALLTSLLWAFVWNQEGTAAEGGQVRHRGNIARWEQGMQNWNRLFYCPRCDHVFDAQTSAAAPPHAAYSLVYADAPPPGILLLEPSTDRMTRASITAAVVAALLIVPAWIGYAADQHAAQDFAQSRTAASAPLMTAFSGMQARVNADLAAAQTASASGGATSSGFSAEDTHRSETLNSLTTASDKLKENRDQAQQAFDTITKASNESELNDGVQDAQNALGEMKSSLAETEQDLGELRRIPLVSTPPNAPPAYQITTAGGGGPRPDTSTFGTP